MRLSKRHSGNRFSSVALAMALLSCTSRRRSDAFVISSNPGSRHRSCEICYNIYDDWRSDAVVDTMHLDEDNVRTCLQEFVESDYGTTMFGCHARAAVVGITGSIEFVEICGPEVTLSLDGKFWHRRSTVLGRAAMWLNARMPEITDVMVADMEDLKDIEEILDDNGDIMFQRDKRSDDFNGDRATMEYQGYVLYMLDSATL